MHLRIVALSLMERKKEKLERSPGLQKHIAAAKRI